jgi:hypothetical protein
MMFYDEQNESPSTHETVHLSSVLTQRIENETNTTIQEDIPLIETRGPFAPRFHRHKLATR